LQGYADLAIPDLAERAAVLSPNADGMRALLGEAGIVQDQQTISFEYLLKMLSQLVADGPLVPGAVGEELLQALLVILGTAVDALQTLGHGPGTLSAAVQE
jgi:hypothetical protein